MDTSKDYYAILGVLPEADPEIIRAVYLALAKKYHPYSAGNPNHVEKMKEINTAYEILKDTAKREKYDAARAEQNDNTGEYEPDIDDDDLSVSDFQDDWDFAVDYRPELDGLLKEVSAISPTLSIVFQSTILNSKAFNEAEEIQNALIVSFLERYFGKSSVVQKFAKGLLVDKNKSAAKELNRAVKIFGGSINEEELIDKICTKYKILHAGKKPTYWPRIHHGRELTMVRYFSWSAMDMVYINVRMDILLFTVPLELWKQKPQNTISICRWLKMVRPCSID